jgi:hypothetical protein
MKMRSLLESPVGFRAASGPSRLSGPAKNGKREN